MRCFSSSGSDVGVPQTKKAFFLLSFPLLEIFFFLFFCPKEAYKTPLHFLAFDLCIITSQIFNYV